jgi:hypothetical protein
MEVCCVCRAREQMAYLNARHQCLFFSWPDCSTVDATGADVSGGIHSNLRTKEKGRGKSGGVELCLCPRHVPCNTATSRPGKLPEFWKWTQERLDSMGMGGICVERRRDKKGFMYGSRAICTVREEQIRGCDISIRPPRHFWGRIVSLIIFAMLILSNVIIFTVLNLRLSRRWQRTLISCGIWRRVIQYNVDDVSVV